MNDCMVCDKHAWHICTSCRMYLCKDHKSVHEQSKKGDHICQKASINITSEYRAKIAENLSTKIKAVNNCRLKIVNTTIALIDKIQTMSNQALRILKAKQKKYTSFSVISKINYSISNLKKLNWN